MTVFIDEKRFLKELRKIKPVEVDQLEEKNRKIRTLFLVLAGDKRVIDEINMEGISELFSDAPDLLNAYDSQTQGCFDVSKLVDYKKSLRRAL